MAKRTMQSEFDAALLINAQQSSFLTSWSIITYLIWWYAKTWFEPFDTLQERKLKKSLYTRVSEAKYSTKLCITRSQKVNVKCRKNLHTHKLWSYDDQISATFFTVALISILKSVKNMQHSIVHNFCKRLDPLELHPCKNMYTLDKNKVISNSLSQNHEKEVLIAFDQCKYWLKKLPNQLKKNLLRYAYQLIFTAWQQGLWRFKKESSMCSSTGQTNPVSV